MSLGFRKETEIKFVELKLKNFPLEKIEQGRLTFAVHILTIPK